MDPVETDPSGTGDSCVVRAIGSGREETPDKLGICPSCTSSRLLGIKRTGQSLAMLLQRLVSEGAQRIFRDRE
jgi:hypothetical protein